MTEDYPVTLGVPADDVIIPAEEGVSKLGGKPHWLCGPPANLATTKCKSCGTNLELILTCDCPIDEENDRLLYLYICPKCGGDAHCWRQKRPANAADVTKPLFSTTDLTTTAPAGGKPSLLDGFGFGAPPPQQQTGGKKKKGKKPVVQIEKGHWPGIYIDTFDEPEARLDPSMKVIMSTSVDSTSSAAGNEEEQANEVSPELVDFNEHMSREPSQVLRYCRYGTPIVMDKINLEIPKCSCGADRIFEFQLMPTVIYYLDPESDMDFGTVLVYTCSNDCDQCHDEFVYVCPP